MSALPSSAITHLADRADTNRMREKWLSSCTSLTSSADCQHVFRVWNAWAGAAGAVDTACGTCMVASRGGNGPNEMHRPGEVGAMVGGFAGVAEMLEEYVRCGFAGSSGPYAGFERFMFLRCAMVFRVGFPAMVATGVLLLLIWGLINLFSRALGYGDCAAEKFRYVSCCGRAV